MPSHLVLFFLPFLLLSPALFPQASRSFDNLHFLKTLLTKVVSIIHSLPIPLILASSLQQGICQRWPGIQASILLVGDLCSRLPYRPLIDDSTERSTASSSAFDSHFFSSSSYLILFTCSFLQGNSRNASFPQTLARPNPKTPNPRHNLSAPTTAGNFSSNNRGTEPSCHALSAAAE